MTFPHSFLFLLQGGATILAVTPQLEMKKSPYCLSGCPRFLCYMDTHLCACTDIKVRVNKVTRTVHIYVQLHQSIGVLASSTTPSHRTLNSGPQIHDSPMTMPLVQAVPAGWLGDAIYIRRIKKYSEADVERTREFVVLEG
ncbi:hypothetical protein M513_08777, partial [Trichuris suis]